MRELIRGTSTLVGTGWYSVLGRQPPESAQPTEYQVRMFKNINTVDGVGGRDGSFRQSTGPPVTGRC